MIDHDYQIITREVQSSASRARRFVAKLSKFYLIVDGKRTEAAYPQTEFIGDTRVAAMLKANDALRQWLKDREACCGSLR